MFKTGIGQDSHRFEPDSSQKILMLGGVPVPGCPGLLGNSDADVVLHALTNAVSAITGNNILGSTSDRMCLQQGITDSARYVEAAMESLGDYSLTHVSIAIEGQRPKLEYVIPAIKASLAKIVGLFPSDIGVTVTSGEGLTAFGRGEGLQAFATVSAIHKNMLSQSRESQ